jgi:hypothetical protein
MGQKDYSYKNLLVTNTLAYFGPTGVAKKESFKGFGPVFFTQDPFCPVHWAIAFVILLDVLRQKFKNFFSIIS